MDIKLRARLSAYSRIGDPSSIPDIPEDGETCDRVTEQEIDTLFQKKITTTSNSSQRQSVVSYSEIDSLFV